MDESRIGQYSISVTTYPIMALLIVYINIFKSKFYTHHIAASIAKYEMQKSD